MILTADIGGTKTVLAAAQSGETGIELFFKHRYPSKEYASFEAILDLYLSEYPSIRAESLCVAVAGPVIGNRCTVTNLGMTVDGAGLSQRTGISKTVLINDLEASGYGLEMLPEESLQRIQSGEAVDGNRVLISPGTGLGTSIIHFIDGRYIPVPSEGGHADFAPFDGVTRRLWSFLKRTQARVSIEDVLSGPGLNNIYKFMVSENGAELSEELRAEMEANPGRAIARQAVEKNDPLSVLAVRHFLDILAAQSGNLALTAMPHGGIYIGGGIVPQILLFLDKKRFASVMAAKGIHRPILEKFPVSMVTDTNLPLYGAANYILSSG